MKSNLKKSKHSIASQQQRGISNLSIRLIEEFGTFKYQKGGAEVAFIDHATLKELRAAINRLESVRLIVSNDNVVISAMHGYKRITTTELSC